MHLPRQYSRPGTIPPRSASVRTVFQSVVRAASRTAAIMSLALAAACDDDPTSKITVSTTSSTVNAQPGIPGTATINIVRTGTFTGEVTLAVEGLPAGVTASFNPPTLGTGVTATALTLTAGTTAASGNTTLTVRATGAGTSAGTATIQLTVLAANINFAAGVTGATVAQGLTATVPLTIERFGGFTGAVNVAVEGLPANVTGTFNPGSFGTGVTSSTLTIAAAAGAPIGSSTITLRATGTGIADRTVPIALTIVSGVAAGFTLASPNAAVSVVPGGSVTSTINITRVGGFIDNVQFSNSTVPTGVVATFTPNPANLNSTVLQFATTTAAPPGVYTIVVSGGAPSITTATVNVQLTIASPPGATMVLAPTALPVAAGQSVQSTATVTRVGGFTGDLVMSADNLPAGATATFSVPTLTAAQTATTVTFATTTATLLGIYTVNVKATGAGGIVASAPFTLTVTGAQSIAVAFTSPTVTVAPGGTGTLTANITRTNFAGTVNFTVTGLATGVTATPAPAAATGGTTTLNVAVAGNVAAGNYTGTLNGTGTGVTATATPFTVTVSGAGVGSIQWQFCDPTRIPLFFAIRNGATGAWTRVTPNASNVFSFDITQAVGGVAYVLPNSNGFATTVFLQTSAELGQLALSECNNFPGTGGKTATGTVAGLGAGQVANISLGTANATAFSPILSYTLNNIQAGPQDLVATRSTLNLTTFASELDRIIIRRGLNPVTGSVIAPALDFGAPESFSPVQAVLTIGNLGADNSIMQTSLSTTASGNALLTSSGVPSAVATRTIYGVPTAQLIAGDLHQMLTSALDAGAASFRGAFTYFRVVADKTVTLGGPINAPTLTTTSGAVLRPRAQGTIQAEYPTGLGVTFLQNTGNKSVTVSASPGYTGGSTYDLEVPDLAGLAGFNTAWGLAVGGTTTYTFTGSNAPTAAIADGTQWLFASRTGTVIATGIRSSR